MVDKDKGKESKGHEGSERFGKPSPAPKPASKKRKTK